MIKTSPSYSVVLRVEIPNRPGMLGKVMSVNTGNVKGESYVV